MPITANPLLIRIIDDLTTQGWSQQNLFLDPSLTLELAAECRQRAELGLLVAAGVGRGSMQTVREGIRGDQIHWVEPGDTPAGDAYLQAMNLLREALNVGLYLGLEDYEGHFALYPPGAGYLPHLDRFSEDDRRVISVVFYLNEAWQDEQGGALRLYFDQGDSLDIAPLAGRLVVFLSADRLHEVRPATHERLSLTGWFRRRGLSPL